MDRLGDIARWLARGALGVGLLAPGLARADERAPGDLQGLRRAFFDVDILYWQTTNGDPDASPQPPAHSDGAGVVGYHRVPFGLGLAYAPSERWVVGGRIDAAVEPGRDGAPLTVRGAIGPFAELAFMRNRQVRPFAIVRANIGRAQAFSRGGASGEEVATRAVALAPSVGAGLGSHVFLSEHLSFDAMLVLDYRWNFVRGSPNVAAAPATQRDTSIQPEGWRLRDGTLGTALTFGLSHWW